MTVEIGWLLHVCLFMEVSIETSMVYSKNYRFKNREKTENFVTADIKTFEKIPKHWQARDVIKKNK